MVVVGCGVGCGVGVGVTVGGVVAGFGLGDGVAIGKAALSAVRIVPPALGSETVDKAVATLRASVTNTGSLFTS